MQVAINASLVFRTVLQTSSDNTVWFFYIITAYVILKRREKVEVTLMARSFSSNLRGKVRNFSLPKNRPLVPLYEAIVNSLKLRT